MYIKSKILLRKLYYFLSPKNRLLVRKLVYYPSDVLNFFRSKNQDAIPNKGDIFIGSGNFIEQGEHQLALLKAYANISENGNILDVGSGIGRTAFALKKFLSKNANYDGFDVVEKGVNWCQKNITAKQPNFKFKYVSLNNDLYHFAENDAKKFSFPYPSNYYDTVFLFSVFTHMQPEEIQNYLNEIYRVLSKNGKCLATFFYYNHNNEVAISENNGDFIFPYKKNGYRIMNKKVPSANIAFEEDFLKNMIKSAGLELVQIKEGSWKSSKKSDSLNDFQDLFILEKIN